MDIVVVVRILCHDHGRDKIVDMFCHGHSRIAADMLCPGPDIYIKNRIRPYTT